MQGARRAVWRATQADCNAVARPNPTGQMGNLFLATSLAQTGFHTVQQQELAPTS